MNEYRGAQVLNGTYGELWIDGEYMAEVTAFEAKVELETTAINQTRTLTEATKVVGIKCSGTIKLNKTTSYFIKLMSDNIKRGKQTVCTIISNLNDPDAMGAERIVVKDATFTELMLANWEAKKAGEESIPFTFTSWDVMDSI